MEHACTVLLLVSLVSVKSGMCPDKQLITHQCVHLLYWYQPPSYPSWIVLLISSNSSLVTTTMSLISSTSSSVSREIELILEMGKYHMSTVEHKWNYSYLGLRQLPNSIPWPVGPQLWWLALQVCTNIYQAPGLVLDPGVIL